jgi:hypothetical protein
MTDPVPQDPTPENNPTPESTPETQNIDLGLNQFLTGDLAQNETLGRFKQVPDLANSYLELRQKMGEAIVKPGKDASEADIQKYHRALGAPEKAEEYGLKHDTFEDIPLSEDAVSSFMEVGHKHGATPELMNALFQWYGQTTTDQMKADIDLVNAAHAEQDALLKKEWGGEYDAFMATIGAVKNNIFSEETQKEIEESRLGDNVNFMKDILTLAQKMSETSISGTTKGLTDPIETPLSLKEEAKKLQREDDYWTSHVKQARVQEIFKKIAELQKSS